MNPEIRREIPIDEPMPLTAVAIWDRLRARRNELNRSSNYSWPAITNQRQKVVTRTGAAPRKSHRCLMNLGTPMNGSQHRAWIVSNL